MQENNLTEKLSNRCIILIGMAASGKSTVGRALADTLGWAYVDSDNLIDAVYGAELQTIADATDKESFIEIEADVICSIRLCRTVIATGGSVVYRERSMKHLSSLGPIVFLDVPFSVINKRLMLKPDRGLAIAPGQTFEDLFKERDSLYRHYAELSVPFDNMPPKEYAEKIIEIINNKFA